MFELFPSLSKSVPELLEELRSGTPEAAGDAFNLLHAEIAHTVEAQVYATVRRNVTSLSLRKQVIEEALAETWFAVIKGRQGFAGTDLDSFRKWVCGIVRNKALQGMRNTFGRKERALCDVEEPSDGALAMDAIEENVAIKAAVDEALHRVCRTEKQRRLAVRVLEAHIAGCKSGAEAYRQAAMVGEGAAWIKEVWLDLRGRLRSDPSLANLQEDRSPAALR